MRLLICVCESVCVFAKLRVSTNQLGITPLSAGTSVCVAFLDYVFRRTASISPFSLPLFDFILISLAHTRCLKAAVTPHFLSLLRFPPSCSFVKSVTLIGLLSYLWCSVAYKHRQTENTFLPCRVFFCLTAVVKEFKYVH